MGPASQCGLGLIIMQSVGFKVYNKAYQLKNRQYGRGVYVSYLKVHNLSDMW